MMHVANSVQRTSLAGTDCVPKLKSLGPISLKPWPSTVTAVPPASVHQPGSRSLSRGRRQNGLQGSSSRCRRMRLMTSTKPPTSAGGLVTASWKGETTVIEELEAKEGPNFMLCTLKKHAPVTATLVPPARGPEFGKILNLRSVASRLTNALRGVDAAITEIIIPRAIGIRLTDVV